MSDKTKITRAQADGSTRLDALANLESFLREKTGGMPERGTVRISGHWLNLSATKWGFVAEWSE